MGGAGCCCSAAAASRNETVRGRGEECREFAEGNDEVIKHIAQPIVARYDSALAESGNGALHNNLVHRRLKDIRDGGDRRTPREKKHILVVCARVCSEVCASGRCRALQHDLPLVVIADGTHLLVRHHYFPCLDRVVDELQKVRWIVALCIDAALIANKVRNGHWLFHARIVLVRVKLHDRIRENVRAVPVSDVPVRVAIHCVIAVRKALYDAVNNLRLARQPERLEKQSHRLVNPQPCKVIRRYKRTKHLNVVLVANVLSYHLLIQSRIVPQKLGDGDGVDGLRQQPVLLEKLDTLSRLDVELLGARHEQLLPLPVLNQLLRSW
eukprot:Opistho-2@38657